MAKPSFLFLEPYSLSLTPLEVGAFLVASRRKGKREELLFVGLFNPRQPLSSLKRDVLNLVAESSPLDAVGVRSGLPFEQKRAMTWHLLQVLKQPEELPKSPAEGLAFQYTTLLSWGESAAAKVLADEESISVRTMHSRLRMARERGLLDSPGSGARLGMP